MKVDAKKAKRPRHKRQPTLRLQLNAKTIKRQKRPNTMKVDAKKAKRPRHKRQPTLRLQLNAKTMNRQNTDQPCTTYFNAPSVFLNTYICIRTRKEQYQNKFRIRLFILRLG